MNLYKISFEHISDHSEADGIVDYVLAQNDEQVFDFITDNHAYSWRDIDEDNDWNYEYIDDEKVPLREYLISNKGDIGRDDSDDVTYGQNHYGWELIEENIQDDDYQVLVRLKVAKDLTQ